MLKELLNWIETRDLRRIKKRKERMLREAQERYAELKAEKEAMELMAKQQHAEAFYFFNGRHYTDICGELGKYEERVEQLMRDQ